MYVFVYVLIWFLFDCKSWRWFFQYLNEYIIQYLFFYSKYNHFFFLIFFKFALNSFGILLFYSKLFILISSRSSKRTFFSELDLIIISFSFFSGVFTMFFNDLFFLTLKFYSLLFFLWVLISLILSANSLINSFIFPSLWTINPYLKFIC